MIDNLVIDPDGTKRYYKYSALHRVDGPAVIWTDDTTFWYKDGLQHRVDGPAIEYSNGEKAWYLNGNLIYDKYINNVLKFKELLSDPLKKSILKYALIHSYEETIELLK